MAKVLLSGKYDLNTIFTDEVRAPFNKGGSKRTFYEEKMAIVDSIKEKMEKNSNNISKELSTYAIRFAISQDMPIIAIPGATSPQQVLENIEAGKRTLSQMELSLLE